MSFIKGRLRRLEGRMQGGRCPECGLMADGPGRIVLIDDGTPAEGSPTTQGSTVAAVTAHCGA